MGTTIKVKNGTPVGTDSLCRTCRWVHMQKGFRESEEAIFCDYGSLHRMSFKVAECTEYLDRTIPTRNEMEKIALLIHVEPARTHVGFTNATGFALDTSDEKMDEND